MPVEHETAIIKAEAVSEFYTVGINIAAARCVGKYEFEIKFLQVFRVAGKITFED